MKKQCNRCRFAVPGAENDAHLYCHRYPPQALAITNGDKSGVTFPFPAVTPGGWCGEFRQAWNRLIRGHVQARA